MINLLDNVSVDTVGEGFNTLGTDGVLAIYADNFGGGSVSIELSPDGGATWIIATQNGLPFSATANATVTINRVGQSMKIRAVLAGSTGASNVNARYFN
jgi:hypothetical protein